MLETESLPLLDKVELLKLRPQTVTGGDNKNHNNLSFIGQIESDEADKKRGGLVAGSNQSGNVAVNVACAEIIWLQVRSGTTAEYWTFLAVVDVVFCWWQNLFCETFPS